MRVRRKPVALTVILRLWWVLRITARQSNSMLEPTNACEPNDVRLERRCGSANRYAERQRGDVIRKLKTIYHCFS
jgi:hypothetical protein